MELVRWEPFDGMSRLHSRINDLFDESVGRARTLPSATAGAWLPPVDILESKEAYLIRAELPGMKKEDFNLEVNDGTLTLSGERKAEGLSNGVEIHRTERNDRRLESDTVLRNSPRSCLAASRSLTSSET